MVTIIKQYFPELIKLADKGSNLEENKEKMMENIQNGKALEKFKQLVINQGGDVTYIEDINKFKKAKYIMPVALKKGGIVKELKAEEIGKLSVFLGAGRLRKEDKIEHEVGIVLNKKIGDEVKKDDIVAYIHANDEEKARKAVERLQETYLLGQW